MGLESEWSRSGWVGYVGSRSVHLVEVGFAREGLASATTASKRAQHGLLEILLTSLRWQVSYHTVTLGVTGAIYSDAVAALPALGITPQLAHTVCTSWTYLAINHTHGLVLQRRLLDSHLISQAFQKPP